MFHGEFANGVLNSSELCLNLVTLKNSSVLFNIPLPYKTSNVEPFISLKLTPLIFKPETLTVAFNLRTAYKVEILTTFPICAGVALLSLP